MKKIMIKKFEDKSPPRPSASGSRDGGNSSGFQPPLPIGPPPPPSPLHHTPLLEIKKEVEDDGYNSHSSSNALSRDKTEEPQERIQEESKPVDPRPMCRRFVRGTCTKGASCKFKHEIEVSQLRGIFKFCWDYQNKVCNRQLCKHVHATVFEEQKFYRTGYLPPSAFDHMNGEKPSDTSAQAAAVSEPESAPSNSGNIANTSYSEMDNDEQYKLLRSLFSDAAFSRQQEEHETRESETTKKCEHCDLNEFRVVQSKQTMEDIMRSTLKLKESSKTMARKIHLIREIVSHDRFEELLSHFQ